VLNEHNTVFASKRSAIRAQAVYLLHSTMPSVTCLRMSDVSVICRVTYLLFPIQACFFFMSLSQASQQRTVRGLRNVSEMNVSENLGRFIVRSVHPRRMILN